MNKVKNPMIPLMILTFGVFMAALDNGIISAALTTINRSFDVSEIYGSWGITLYTLGMAISTPIIGKFADRYGRKKLFLIEISLFALGSLLVALSPNFYFFLGARLVQSLGGGGIFIIASSFVLTVFPAEKQGRFLGMLGALHSIAAVLGPNIGSLILSMTNNWHWLFFINLPIALILLIAGRYLIPETTGHTAGKIDFIGIALLAAGIFSFMLGITNLDATHLANSFLTISVLGWLIAAIICFCLLVLVEKKQQDKNIDTILPYTLLTNKNFVMTLAMGFLSGTLIAIFVYIPSFVEQRFGVASNHAGIWVSGIGLASIFGAGLGGFLVDKLGAKNTTKLAGGISFIGYLGIAFLSTSLLTFFLLSCVTGFGFGMLMGAPLSILAASAAHTEKGVALGSLSVTRQVGLTIAPTIYAAVVAGGFSHLQDNLSMIATNKQAIAKLFAQNNGQEQILLALQKGHFEPKMDLLQTFYQVASSAYGKMFLVAAIASLLIALLAVFIKADGHSR